MQISPELQHALQDASHVLSQTSSSWLIGGSCGLLLQNVHLDNSPGDIDIYTDTDSVSELHHALKDWATDMPVLSVTDRYQSTLSHYQLREYTLELVGGFLVQAAGSSYKVEVNGQLAPSECVALLDQIRLPLMPLSHELIFNLLRERPDRYEPIAERMKANIFAHLPLMEKLLSTNPLHHNHVRQLSELLGESSLQNYAMNEGKRLEESRNTNEA